MTEPKQVIIARYDIVDMSITLPSGKKLSINRGKPYITGDQDELDFLSRQKGLVVTGIDDKSFRTWVTEQVLPTVDKDLSDADAAEFKWYDEHEEAVVEELKERGYIVYKKKTKEDEEE